VVCNKVVIEPRQVRASAVQELDSGLDIQTQCMSALYNAHNLLLCLFQQLLLSLEVLDDRGRIRDGGERCDVVQRRFFCESALRRALEEPLVRVAERHGADCRKDGLLLNAV